LLERIRTSSIPYFHQKALNSATSVMSLLKLLSLNANAYFRGVFKAFTGD